MVSWGGGKVAPSAPKRRAGRQWCLFDAPLVHGGKMDEARREQGKVVLRERGDGIWKANSSVCTLNKCHAVLEKLQRAVRFQSIS